MLEDEGHGSLELLVGSRREQEGADALRQQQLDAGRRNVDAARLAMAALAEDAVKVVACRLWGLTQDEAGVRVTDERLDAALVVLDRIGIPKLRATAIAASIAAAPTNAAPGSPGWEPPQVEDGANEAIDVGSVDAMISIFLEGAAAAQRMRDE
jgi:hypothetical protein